MRSKFNQRITTFEELNAAKKKLSVQIKAQEEEILSNPIISIPAAILQGGSFKSSLRSSMESVSLDHYKSAAINLLSSFLMANKKTRKFFVAFIIAKEMVPFILQKINEYVKK
ncbi:hypothetical protein LCM02_07380 [Lutimonas saemankumensis]|uniref:hypothetical protein n=1 Tax=Lutimonas saemankumensis TaxID=483016 RepID=UPI001CD486F7|nr:hypothetical protein [Lutimonas saemankumensis]MCA0932267.1 hypothetical protein [Lutimonas saemankumensis]